VSFPSRLEFFLTELDTTRGSDIQKTRPSLAVSPDEINRHLRTVIVAPVASSGSVYPFRIPIFFGGKGGRVALDELPTIHRVRPIRRLGSPSPQEGDAVLPAFVDTFAP